jgi:hypothetical protein
MKDWIKLLALVLFLCQCSNEKRPDGFAVELQILHDNNLSKDYSDPLLLEEAIKDINCSHASVLRKKIVLAKEYHAGDTNSILLIPFISNGSTFKSSAYSDVENRFILISPSYIRDFTVKNTLNDTLAFSPVLKMMLLHEVGHFLLNKSGSFDKIESRPATGLGEQTRDDTQPVFLTADKKLELAADSLAMDIVKRKLAGRDYTCLGAAFDIQRIVPGMQFQLAGMRIIENFGSRSINYLHDPSNDHPNLELRVTFMNYFLFPSDTLRQMIEDYLYDRTVAPVHRQEFDPRIFQGQEKILPDQ